MTPDDYGLLRQMQRAGSYDANRIVGILSEEPFFQTETGVQALLHHAKLDAGILNFRQSALSLAIDIVRYMKNAQRLGDLVAAIVLMSTPTQRKTLAQEEHEAQVNDLRAKLANTERLLAQANQAVADLTAHCWHEYQVHEQELANLLARFELLEKRYMARGNELNRLHEVLEEAFDARVALEKKLRTAEDAGVARVALMDAYALLIGSLTVQNANLRQQVRDAEHALLTPCLWTHKNTMWYSACGMAYNGGLHPGDTADLRHCPRCGSKIKVA